MTEHEGWKKTGRSGHVLRMFWGQDAGIAFLFLAPALGVLGMFMIAPMLAAVSMSLRGGKQGMGSFVGLGNYVEALGSGAFWNSVRVTLYYVLGTVPVTLGLSFAVAYVLYRLGRGGGYCGCYFLCPM